MTDAPQLTVSRVFDAPRALVYRAFTDPEHFAAWWGPIGNAIPREEMDFDVRPGGHQRWTEVFPDQPDVRVLARIDLTDVVAGELLDGVVRVDGRLPGGFEPYETRMRVEFHDEADGRTRVEVRQWLPDGLDAPSEEGWRQAYSKLVTLLATADPTENDEV